MAFRYEDERIESTALLPPGEDQCRGAVHKPRRYLATEGITIEPSGGRITCSKRPERHVKPSADAVQQFFHGAARRWCDASRAEAIVRGADRTAVECEPDAHITLSKALVQART